MSEPASIFDEVKSRMNQVGGEAWIDELLIRSDATGIRGAHLVVGWSAPGVMGATQSGITNPQPLTLETGDSLWEAVKADINATAVQQVVELSAVIEQRNLELSAAQQQISDLQAALVIATEQIAGLQDQWDHSQNTKPTDAT